MKRGLFVKNMVKPAYMRQVLYHKIIVDTLLEKEAIFGIFLHGSQNYGLDYENSDVDTKALVLPSFKEIALNKRAISTTHILPNEEHIDLKDVRLYFKQFLKQNVNFVEILFTPYFIVNEKYKTIWDNLIFHREDIAHYNMIRAVSTMAGMAREKFHALEHPCESKLSILEKFGYDPKQLHHLLRLKDFIVRYSSGETFENSMFPDAETAGYLREVKRGNAYNLEGARKVAEEALSFIIKQKKEVEANASRYPVKTYVEDFLNEMLIEIFKIRMKEFI